MTEDFQLTSSEKMLILETLQTAKTHGYMTVTIKFHEHRIQVIPVNFQVAPSTVEDLYPKKS